MDNGWVLISEKLQIRASIAFKKHVHKTLREWIDTGLNKKEIVKCIGGTERVSCDNYRIDRQGEPIKAPPFKRQRIAIQINNNPPDPVLRGITRSKGESGGSFSDSKPTIAQFEAEIGLEIGDETPDIVREAFYQSMIPETQYPGMQVLLHRVRVNKKQVVPCLSL